MGTFARDASVAAAGAFAPGAGIGAAASVAGAGAACVGAATAAAGAAGAAGAAEAFTCCEPNASSSSSHWLICWSQRQDTGFHDHDGSRGAVAVVGGALAERRLAAGCAQPPTAIHPAGAAFSFGATHIHDVSQTGSSLATSLHVYSPPLGEMGFYEVAPDGTLSRRTGDYREEFC